MCISPDTQGGQCISPKQKKTEKLRQGFRSEIGYDFIKGSLLTHHCPLSLSQRKTRVLLQISSIYVSLSSAAEKRCSRSEFLSLELYIYCKVVNFNLIDICWSYVHTYLDSHCFVSFRDLSVSDY